MANIGKTVASTTTVVDNQLGDSYPIVEAVYQDLDELKQIRALLPSVIDGLNTYNGVVDNINSIVPTYNTSTGILSIEVTNKENVKTTHEIGKVSLVYRAAFNAGTQYSSLDLVTSNSQLYMAIQDTSSTTVPENNSSDWILVGAKGDKGDNNIVSAIKCYCVTKNTVTTNVNNNNYTLLDNYVTETSPDTVITEAVLRVSEVSFSNLEAISLDYQIDYTTGGTAGSTIVPCRWELIKDELGSHDAVSDVYWLKIYSEPHAPQQTDSSKSVSLDLRMSFSGGAVGIGKLFINNDSTNYPNVPRNRDNNSLFTAHSLTVKITEYND